MFVHAQAPTLWLHDDRYGDRRPDFAPADTWAASRIGVPGLLGGDGELHASAVVRTLAARGLRVLFVEGGGITVSAFLQQGCLDRLHLAVAPVLLGSGRPGLRGPLAATMNEGLRPVAHVLRMGDDVLWDLDLCAIKKALR